MLTVSQMRELQIIVDDIQQKTIQHERAKRGLEEAVAAFDKFRRTVTQPE